MALTPESVRLDLKCGKGAISKGERCTKGPATKEANFGEKALMFGGLAAGAVGLAYGGVRSHRSGQARSAPVTGYKKSLQQSKRASMEDQQAAIGLGVASAGAGAIGAGLAMHGERTKNETTKSAGLNVLGAATLGGVVSYTGYRSARRNTQSYAEEITAETGREKVREARRKKHEAEWKAHQERWRQRAEQNAQRQRKQQQSRQGQSSSNKWQTGGGQRRTQGSRFWEEQQQRQQRQRPNSAVPEPYTTLGVDETATDAEIKKAWLKAIRKHHPDAGGDPETAKQINAAFDEIMRRRGRSDSAASIWASGMEINWEEIKLEVAPWS